MGACWSSSSAAEDGRPLRITRPRGRSNSPSTKKSVRLTERRVHMLTTLSEVPDHIGLDIGGTLVKIVLYQRRDTPPQPGDGPPRLDGLNDHEIEALGASRELSVYVPEVGGDLHFFVFETKHIEDVIDFFARFWP